MHLHDKADVALEALGGRGPIEGDGAFPLHVPTQETHIFRNCQRLYYS